MNLKIRTMKKIISIISLFIGFQLAFTQTYQANIKDVSKDGLHQIILSPEVRSASQNNVNFLRIFDSKNKEVPYVLFEKKSIDSEIKKLEILSKNLYQTKLLLSLSLIRTRSIWIICSLRLPILM